MMISLDAQCISLIAYLNMPREIRKKDDKKIEPYLDEFVRNVVYAKEDYKNLIDPFILAEFSLALSRYRCRLFIDINQFERFNDCFYVYFRLSEELITKITTEENEKTPKCVDIFRKSGWKGLIELINHYRMFFVHPHLR